MNNLSSIVQQLDALPATITKDQFYRICHISKRHAKYLLDSGLVKCCRLRQKDTEIQNRDEGRFGLSDRPGT